MVQIFVVKLSNHFIALCWVLTPQRGIVTRHFLFAVRSQFNFGESRPDGTNTWQKRALAVCTIYDFVFEPKILWSADVPVCRQKNTADEDVCRAQWRGFLGYMPCAQFMTWLLNPKSDCEKL